MPGVRAPPESRAASGESIRTTSPQGRSPRGCPPLTHALVLDALRHRHPPTHLTLDQAVEIAEQVGARRTWFVHMSHNLPHAETNEDLPDGIALAHDGLVLG